MVVDSESEGEGMASDEGVDIPVENMWSDERASYLQEQLSTHPDLKHTSALGKRLPLWLICLSGDSKYMWFRHSLRQQ